MKSPNTVFKQSYKMQLFCTTEFKDMKDIYSTVCIRLSCYILVVLQNVILVNVSSLQYVYKCLHQHWVSVSKLSWIVISLSASTQCIKHVYTDSKSAIGILHGVL